MRKAKKYVFYKGEIILAFGTVKEIAKKMNLSQSTLYYYRTPTYRKRVKKDKFLLVEAKED